jgi:hypothetical protein
MSPARVRRHHLPILLIVAAVVTVILSLIIGTVAYFRDGGAAQNFLYAKLFKVDLIDDFINGRLLLPGDTVSKDVYLVNTGETNAVVRVQLTPSWTPATDGSDNTLLTDAVTILLGSNIGPAPTGQWTYLNGWYYYNQILSPGEATTLLVDGLYLTAFSNDDHAANYEGAEYKLDVSSDSVQVYQSAVQSKWAMTFTVDESDNNTLTWSDYGGA